MHEDIRRKTEITIRSERSFGLTIAAVFAALAVLPALHSEELDAVRWWLLVPAAALLVLAIICPRVLSPLNHLWMKLGVVLARITSPIALAVVYYLTIVPAAWLMRALGKDPLARRFDPTARSYWIIRNPPGPAPGSMTNQF